MKPFIFNIFTNKLILSIFIVLLPVKSVVAMQPVYSANSFIESIGVCTHWNYRDTPYGTRYGEAKLLLKDLGVRYIRDRYSEKSVELYDEYGIKTTAIVQSNIDKNISYFEKNPEILAGIEGPNETNLQYLEHNGFKGFPNATRSFQNELFRKVNSNEKLSSIPVIAPSTAYLGNNELLSPLESFDYAVVHSYPNGRLPSNVLKTLENAQKSLPKGSLAKPIIATESGFHTAYGLGKKEPQGVTELARSKYLLRLIPEYFKQGVVRTHIYEFLSTYENSNRAGKVSEAKYGLISYNMEPTPSYRSLRNLITILNDRKTLENDRGLNLRINGPKSIKSLVLQKSTGSYFLLLWNDVFVYQADPDKKGYGKDIKNKLQKVNVLLPENSDEIVFSYIPRLSSNPTIVKKNGRELNIGVPDDLVIIEFTVKNNYVKKVGMPTNLHSFVNEGEIILRWDKPRAKTDSTGYFVFRMNKYLGFTKKSFFKIENPEADIKYSYYVQAVDKFGNLSSKKKIDVVGY